MKVTTEKAFEVMEGSGEKQNISLHIGNCFREGELSSESTVKEYLTVQIILNRSQA